MWNLSDSRYTFIVCQFFSLLAIKFFVSGLQMHSIDQFRNALSLNIDKPHFCDKFNSPVETLILVKSFANIGKFGWRRKRVRETYGKETQTSNIPVLFVVGESINETIQKSITAESKKYGDILQAKFIDSYYNLTLKTVTALQWAIVNCPQVKYLVYADDDVLINFDLLSRLTKVNYFEEGLTGFLLEDCGPERDPNATWFVSTKDYSLDVYPPYIKGPFTVFTQKALIKLNATFQSCMPALYLDDVYLGIVAEKAGVKLHHSHLVGTDSHTSSLRCCSIQEWLALFLCPEDKLRSIWYSYKKGVQYCVPRDVEKSFFFFLWILMLIVILVIFVVKYSNFYSKRTFKQWFRNRLPFSDYRLLAQSELPIVSDNEV